MVGCSCPFTVLGHHEPNVILKDNDLKHKIRLPTDVARKLLSQLKKDAEFLCSIGIMDYSLLVGVHTTEYAVEDVMEEEPVFGDVEALTGAMENSDDSGHSASKLTSASKPFPLRRRASVRSVMETSYRNKESESRHQLDELTRRLQVWNAHSRWWVHGCETMCR